MAEYTYQELLRKGLEEAFPSAPTTNPKYGFIFRLDGEFRAYYNFRGRYAAKRFVDMVIGDARYVWEDDHTIAFDVPAGRMQIRASAWASWHNDPDKAWTKTKEGESTMMEEVMEHEDGKWESMFVMPMPYPGYARALRQGRVITQTGEDNLAPGEDEVVSRKRRVPHVEEEDRPRERAPARHRTRKAASDENMITVGMIADELGISAREARQRLRKSGVKKPSASWEWPRAEADRVKKTISEFKRK